ncbi:hypothetical protein [Actinomadura napierensis]|uniref:Peptidase M15A C-terminal domain-containing protein n=1 Tax=Actinomadura napierensis TaxID=267854 RepID=A0ABN2YDC3_9ACTN
MNRPHTVRTSTPASAPTPPCPRARRKPASAALTTLLATAAALVATAPPPARAAEDPRPGTGPHPLSPLGVNVPGTLAGLAPSAADALLPAATPTPGRPPDDPAAASSDHITPAPAAAPHSTPAPTPPTSTTSENPISLGAHPTAPAATGGEAGARLPTTGAVAGVLTGAVLPELPKSVRLQQETAALLLEAGGIRWRSTGHCSDRTRTTCTSFDGLRWGTLKGLLDFRAESGCPITVTGGTERGHSGGPRSHGTGYKLDIATSRCVDTAIRRYPYQGVRGDGARLYRSPDGTVFAREKDHWDITFR